MPIVDRLNGSFLLTCTYMFIIHVYKELIFINQVRTRLLIAENAFFKFLQFSYFLLIDSLYFMHETVTMTMNDFGQMPPSMIGPKKWMVWELLLKSMQILPIIRLSVSVHHIFVLEETINSQWWKSKLSCMIQPSQPHYRIHHFGHTPCTLKCHIVATAIYKAVQHVRMPFGRW